VNAEGGLPEERIQKSRSPVEYYTAQFIPETRNYSFRHHTSELTVHKKAQGFEISNSGRNSVSCEVTGGILEGTDFRGVTSRH